MAVNKPTNTTSSTGSTTSMPPVGGLPPTQPQERQPLGLLGIAQAFRGAANRSLTAEVVKRYMDAFKRPMEERGEYRLTEFDLAVQNTKVSAIIVSCKMDTSTGAPMVMAHAIILAASNPRIPARTLTFGNQPVEIPSTASDCFNNGFETKMISLIQSQYPGADVRSAGGSVLHSEVLPDDDARIQRAFAYAAEACAYMMDCLTGFQIRDIFNVGMFEKNDKVIARIESYPVVEAAGIPVRSDLSVATTGQVANQGDVFNRSEVPITTVDIAIDLQYIQAEQAGPNQIQDTRNYGPVATFTKMASEIGAETLELRLTAIHTGTILSTNHAWATPFKPRIGRRLGNVNVRDLAGICYEQLHLVGGQRGVKIDTASPQFDDKAFASLLTANVRDELYFRMQIEECGEMSWLDSIFFMAANKDANAKQTIINAANRLTNNNFGKYWDGSLEIAFNEDTRVPLGYFTDGAANVRRSLTEIGYLELLNLFGETDLEWVTEYDTFQNNRSNPMEVRYKKHLDMLDRVLERQYELKGSAFIIEFNNEFLGALCKGLNDCNFVIQPVNLAQDTTMQQRRGSDRLSGRRGFNSQLAVDAFRFSSPRQQTNNGIGNNLRWQGARR